MIEILNKIKLYVFSNIKNLLILAISFMLVIFLTAFSTWYILSVRFQAEREAYEAQFSDLVAKLTSANVEVDFNEANFSQYGVSFKYPKTLFIKDCSSKFSPPTLSVRLSDVINKADCNAPLKNNAAIHIAIATAQEVNNEKAEKAIVNVDGKGAYYIVKDYELRGDENEKLVSAPQVKSLITYVPYKNGSYLRISYTRIVSTKNNEDGFKVDENLEEEYSYIIKTLKIN